MHEPCYIDYDLLGPASQERGVDASVHSSGLGTDADVSRVVVVQANRSSRPFVPVVRWVVRVKKLRASPSHGFTHPIHKSPGNRPSSDRLGDLDAGRPGRSEFGGSD